MSDTLQVFQIVELEEGVEKELCFEFDYSPAERGSRDHYGAQMEPDYDGHLEFISATDDDGQEVEVSSEDIASAEYKAYEQICDDAEAYDEYDD